MEHKIRFKKPVYKSFSSDQAYTVDCHVSFDKNWCSSFKSEITASLIEPLAAIPMGAPSINGIVSYYRFLSQSSKSSVPADIK
jgi:hypothetical protein